MIDETLFEAEEKMDKAVHVAREELGGLRTGRANASAFARLVVDSTAFSLCMDNGMPMVVFGMEPAGNLTKAIRGDRIGTLVSK